MEVCLASIMDHDYLLELRDGQVFIDGELQPIKYVTNEELEAFDQAIKAIPVSDDPGYHALLCAKQTQFLVSLLGRAVGEECVDMLTHLLDHLHSHILHYLDDDCDCENHHA
ncbi:MAG: hypothetical protein IJS54_00715 [Desulfovibrio sp.]|nr:hypothetical protein [Desulfovibrio sp.]